MSVFKTIRDIRRDRRQAHTRQFEARLDWQCKRCKMMVEPISMRCHCSFGPSPWEPVGFAEEHPSVVNVDASTPTYEQLAAEHEMLIAMMADRDQLEIQVRKMLDTMSAMGVDGKPVFSIGNDQDVTLVRALQHAVVSLHSILDGSPMPEMMMPPQETLN